MSRKQDKKPVWITGHAHQLLKEHCQKTGKTQMDILSELIRSNLTKESTTEGGDRHYGGVWLV